MALSYNDILFRSHISVSLIRADKWPTLIAVKAIYFFFYLMRIVLLKNVSGSVWTRSIFLLLLLRLEKQS